MEYKEAQKEVAVKIFTIKAIIEHGFNSFDDSLENMDQILMQIDRQVVEGRELLKKQSYIDRVLHECSTI